MSEDRFSIQKYEDVEFHYVFRLQSGGKIHSWVVPRGPSPDPRVKRLALPVDSDLDLDFEGQLEAGDRPGRVIVWDSGEFSMFELDGELLSLQDSLAAGRADFHIEGQKLQGGFTLLLVDEQPEERWLLMKIPDAKATSKRNPVVTEPLSILSGRDVKDV